MLGRWPRIVAVQDDAQEIPPPPGATVRRLDERDVGALDGLDEGTRWISDTWGGAAGLATSGNAFGAFLDGRLASVAVPFTVGTRWVDVGVVTEPFARGRGLSPACAARVVGDIRAAGRLPCWTTTPGNAASRRVAEKLGFRAVRDDVAWVAGAPLPEVEPI
jgi:predicted GNAT family acetyltransferase